MDCSSSARVLCPWNPLGKNTRVGFHSLLQKIFPNPGIKPGSPALHVDSFLPEPQGSPFVTESEVKSCLTLCDPIDYSLPGFSIHGIFQARVLEWVAISLTEVGPYSLLTFDIFIYARFHLLLPKNCFVSYKLHFAL